MRGATIQAVQQLDFNVDKVSEILKKIPSANMSPIINAIQRGDEKWTGDPRYYSLFYYMHAAATESARILSGGQASRAQLHQGAMDEAKEWANINLTPESWLAPDGVANAMKSEGQYRLQTYKDAIKAQEHGGEETPQIGDIKMYRGKRYQLRQPDWQQQSSWVELPGQ
jgi:hypothetical protein